MFFGNVADADPLQEPLDLQIALFKRGPEGREAGLAVHREQWLRAAGDARHQRVKIVRQLYQPLDEGGLDEWHVAGDNEGPVACSGGKAAVNAGKGSLAGVKVWDRLARKVCRCGPLRPVDGDQDLRDERLQDVDDPFQEEGRLVFTEAAALTAGEDDGGGGRGNPPTP